MTLSMPPRAAQAAVRAEQWVHTYRHSVVVFHAGDRRFRGECLRAWFLQPHARGRSRHWHGRHEGSLLLLARAPVALATGKGLTAVLARGKGRVVLAVGHRLPRLPTFLAVGIGCTGGRHRSVYFANELAAHLRAAHLQAFVEYRDVQR